MAQLYGGGGPEYNSFVYRWGTLVGAGREDVGVVGAVGEVAAFTPGITPSDSSIDDKSSIISSVIGGPVAGIGRDASKERWVVAVFNGTVDAGWIGGRAIAASTFIN